MQNSVAPVVAVLGAAAGLDRDDALHLDVLAAVLQAHFVCQLEGGGKRLIGKPENVHELAFAQPDALLKDLLPGGLENFVAGHGRVCLNRH
ncbi:MAG: hypothetical protein K0S72_857 [Arthrobacter sp.]|nr:hypothetical protein [Arthrobacter sp.]